MTKHRSNKEKEVVSEEGIKSMQGKEKPVKKAVVNPKLDEECDTNELTTSKNSKLFCPIYNNTLNTAPEMSSLDTETPPTAQSSPKEQSVLEFVEEND